MIVSTTILAAPPSLENHQFYGQIKWNDTGATYLQVIAQVGNEQFVSAIQGVECTTYCTANYGYNTDNILRVQGKVNDKITISVDDIKITTVNYKKNGVSELDLLVPQVDLDELNETCLPNFNCTDWTSCLLGKQNRTCSDISLCVNDTVEIQQCTEDNTSLDLPPDELNLPEEEPTPDETPDSAAKPKSSLASCSYQWDCSTWSICENDQQRRTCSRSDDCNARVQAGELLEVKIIPKPEEVKLCSSGDAEPEDLLPPVEQSPLSLMDKVKENLVVVISVIAALLLVIGLIIFLLVHNSSSLAPAKKAQIQRYLQTSLKRGVSKQQAVANLVKAGWKENDVKKVIKSLGKD